MRCEKIGDRYFFWCPGCDENHAPTASWTFNGDYEKPTFSPSILVRAPDPDNPGKYVRVCHSFVKDGQIQFLSDCTHKLAGQTVDLPEYE